MSRIDPPLDSRQSFLVHGLGMSSPGYWAGFVEYKWSLIAQYWRALKDLIDHCEANNAPIPEMQGIDGRLYYSALMGFEGVSLIQGARHVLRYRDLYVKYTGDLASLVPDDERDYALIDIQACRDAIEHFDAYSLGRGRIPLPPMIGGNVEITTGPEDAVFVLGRYRIPLADAVIATKTLANRLDKVWEKHLR